MPRRTQVSRELLAPREDVWRFATERLSDWWPGAAAVERDRRGLAPGARWTVRGQAPDLLVVREVRPAELFAFSLIGSRQDVELRLGEAARDRTAATLVVERPWLRATRDRLRAREALTRLYDLCQTGAEV